MTSKANYDGERWEINQRVTPVTSKTGLNTSSVTLSTKMMLCVLVALVLHRIVGITISIENEYSRDKILPNKVYLAIFVLLHS